MISNQTDQSPRTYHRVLTIAGSDSGGGAGIQADLKTFSALGCYGMSVITALTAQNTTGVTGIHPVPPDFVRQQMEAVLSDIGVNAVKIGMLFSLELIKTVADTLAEYQISNIVLDPVMIAQSGDKLLQDDAIEAISSHLLPMADILTPNLPEAEVLTGGAIKSRSERIKAAEKLSQTGCKAVLIKGGHLEGNHSNDHLYIAAENRTIELEGERILTRNNHGTGCTLSSAIASMLARGNSLEEAVSLGKEYIHGAIKAGADYQIGNGHGPVHHFYQHWS
jgi:hydroxymethylpyrimidine kinase/phosphomethylpyrimidine kinase